LVVKTHQVSDNRLILREVKKQEALAKEGKSREYREEPCYESVALPAGINKDRVRATYHNGVLTVTFPKTAEAKAKKITVEST
jgi:HSP20 family protein